MIKEITLPVDPALTEARTLIAGSLTCLYEAGNIRYVTLGRTELVRKVYAAVRNDIWTTLPCEIRDENITMNESGFYLTYTAIYGLETPLYKADYIIEGNANNTISFIMQGIALGNFKRNRIGLCLHHPLKECMGRKVMVIKPDGDVYQSVFPQLVSPILPFLEIQQLEWTSEDAVTVNLDFGGDVFETEDQRNWSDGSFKTYSTRSALPRPVDVKRGDVINQKITLTVSTKSKADSFITPKESSEVKVPFPQIGYMKTAGAGPVNKAQAEWLIRIPFDHYRVTIVMNQHAWKHRLQESLSEADLINTKLELVVFFSDDFKNEIGQLIGELKDGQLLVRSMLVLHKHHTVSSVELLDYLYPVIKAGLPAVKVGYGTDLIFVDLNENRPTGQNFDFISFGLQPQAHAFDNRSILENLRSQPYIMQTALSFSQGQPVCISPVTLKDRHSGADDRQYSSLTALYTLCSIQNFSEAYSITFYELFGAKGILEIEDDKAGVKIKQSSAYEMLVEIFIFKPVWVIKRFIGDELLMDGLLLENEQGDRLFFKSPEAYTFFKEG